ncbi:MAG TPA: hypothetical protein DEP35_18335 [Deltaproteobacteria bacterium]|jgi:uncharacterized MAPEG superfamily protein|nr:hypothetical protein [Deltaproteobacteria bacterium]
MTTPFLCLAIACLLPYIWAPFQIPERIKQLGSVDNKLPRVQQAQLQGRGARALGAHQNAFEALITFAPAVLVAHLAGADAVWSARLAVLFLVCRILHGIFYLADLDRARSAIFTVGFACVIGLFVLAGVAAH